MKIKVIAIMLILLAWSNNIDGQSRAKIAEKQIKELKQGVLLVRLKKSENQISQLEKVEEFKKAKKLRIEEEEINQSIIKGFEEYFDFCEYYFFYANNVQEVKQGNYEVLFDSKGKNVEKLEYESIYFSGLSRIQYDTEFRLGDEGLVIMDNELKQLEKPFPFHCYLANFTALSRHREIVYNMDSEYEGMVYRLNHILNKYYDKLERKQKRKGK